MLAPGVELLPPGPGQPQWTPELVAELRLGLAALPERLRAPPTGTLKLSLHAEPSDFGLGDGSPQRPEWSGALEVFHLYAFREGSEPRASARLAGLSPSEREALWRRRAVVHALVRRWDAHLGLSSTGGWRRASDWLAPGERAGVLKHAPYNTYAWSFSRHRGEASVALDLATFAEELYAPAESVRADALASDDQVRCQEFSKARALAAALEAAGLAAAAPRGPCPAFERWARPAQLSHLEVLFVAATNRPESMFGHMMLRPVFRPGPEAVEAPGFGTVVQLSAWVDPRHGPFEYLWRGLTGGYTTVVSASPTFLALGPVLAREQRSVRRFRLQLPPEANLRLMERIWELERRGFFQYRFFSDNCATVLLRLVNVALDDAHQVRVRNPIFVAPAAMLDALARVELKGPDGARRTLLAPEAGALLSSFDRALLAEARRAESAALLAQALPPAEGQALLLAHGASRSRQAAARAAGYRDAGRLFERALLAADARAAGLAHAWLRDSVAVEQALLDLLEERRRLAAPPAMAAGPSVEEVLARRQRYFQSESRPPEQEEPPPPEPAWLSPEDEVAFDAAVDALGALSEGALGGASPRALLEQEAAARAEAERAEAQAGLPRSGWTRLGAFGGAALSSQGAVAGVAGIRSALLLEELGEPLQHAYSPTTEVALLAIELLVASGPRGAALAGEAVTLFRYRTLASGLPQQAPALPMGLGWGVGLHFDDARLLGHEPRFAFGGELLASSGALESPSRRLFVLSAGGEVQVRLRADRAVPALAPRLGLLHRVALGERRFNALRAQLEWSPAFVLGGPVVHELRAKAELSVLLPRLLGFHWLFKPEARAGFAVEPGGLVRPGVMLAAGLEAL